MASMKNHPVNEKDCRGSDLSRKMACAAKKPELVSSMILGLRIIYGTRLQPTESNGNALATTSDSRVK
jgi:hypothetical protein